VTSLVRYGRDAENFLCNICDNTCDIYCVEAIGVHTEPSMNVTESFPAVFSAVIAMMFSITGIIFTVRRNWKAARAMIVFTAVMLILAIVYVGIGVVL